MHVKYVVQKTFSLSGYIHFLQSLSKLGVSLMAYFLSALNIFQIRQNLYLDARHQNINLIRYCNAEVSCGNIWEGTNKVTRKVSRQQTVKTHLMSTPSPLPKKKRTMIAGREEAKRYVKYTFSSMTTKYRWM